MGYRIVDDLEHPDITAMLKYGYPLSHLPVEQWCDSCGSVIDGTIYKDEDHEYLCEECLLALHKKELFA